MVQDFDFYDAIHHLKIRARETMAARVMRMLSNLEYQLEYQNSMLFHDNESRLEYRLRVQPIPCVTEKTISFDFRRDNIDDIIALLSEQFDSTRIVKVSISQRYDHIEFTVDDTDDLVVLKLLWPIS